MRLRVCLLMYEDSNLVADVRIIEEGSPEQALQNCQAEDRLRMITANHANDWVDALLCKAAVFRRLVADKKLTGDAGDAQELTTKEEAARHLGCDLGGRYQEMYNSGPSHIRQTEAAEILAAQIIGEWNRASRPGFIQAYLQSCDPDEREDREPG